MPQKNGPRSSRGRSSIARRVTFGGASPTNGIMPSVEVITSTGKRIKTSYFGGNKKGGSMASATGQMRPTSLLSRSLPGEGINNYLFMFKTNYGPRPFGPHIL